MNFKIALNIFLISTIFAGSLKSAKVNNGRISFNISKDNQIYMTIDFKINDANTTSPYLMILPFLFEDKIESHSNNCLVVGCNLKKNGIVFVYPISLDDRIIFRVTKMGSVSSVGDNTFREVIRFSPAEIDKSILSSIKNCNNYIGFEEFYYSVNYDPFINKATTAVKPDTIGAFIEIIRNDNCLIIQYTGFKGKEKLIWQCVYSFFVSLATLILTLFFVKLETIIVSKRKLIIFMVVTSFFVVINSFAIILLFMKAILNVLLPLSFFMSPYSIAFITILVIVLRTRSKSVFSENQNVGE